MESLRKALCGGNRKATLLLLMTPVIVTTYRYFGDRTFYREHLAAHVVLFGDAALTAVLYSFVSCLLLLGLIPGTIVRLLFREPLRAYGAQVGDLRYGGRALLVMAPVMVAVSVVGAMTTDLRAEYPLYKGLATGPLSLFIGYAFAYLLYYLGWELFFRGFLQFGLRESLGDVNAILIQTLASCLAHLGKPAGEIYGAILAGIVWGIIAFRTRSILVVLLAHWLLGVSLDALISFGGLPVL